MRALLPLPLLIAVWLLWQFCSSSNRNDISPNGNSFTFLPFVWRTSPLSSSVIAFAEFMVREPPFAFKLSYVFVAVLLDGDKRKFNLLSFVDIFPANTKKRERDVLAGQWTHMHVVWPLPNGLYAIAFVSCREWSLISHDLCIFCEREVKINIFPINKFRNCSTNTLIILFSNRQQCE